MYPGGGRLLELRAPRLQRAVVVLRRVGADAQLHDHDRHLGVLRAALPRRAVLAGAAARPRRHLFGIAVVAVLSVVNVVGVKEAAGLNIVLAITDLATQLLLVIVGIVLVLSPHVLIDNVHLGVAPSWKNFLVAIPIGMIAYTGIETISNMAEEARDETKTIPRAIKFVVLAVFAIYAALPMVALSALPVHKGADGNYTTLLGTAEDKGGFAGDPVLGIVKHLHLGASAVDRRDLRRPARRDDPVHRRQRRHHRRLAAGLLDGPAPPGARPSQPPASALLHAVDRHPAVRRRRLPDDHPRPGRIPRQHVRVRGDALVHDRAPVGDRLRVKEPDRPRPYRGPGTLHVAGRSCPCSRCWASSAPASRSSSSPCCTSPSPPPACSGWRSGMVLYIVYRKQQGLDLRTTTKAPRPERPPDFEEFDYRTALVPIFGKDISASVLDSAAKLIGERRRRLRDLRAARAQPAVARGRPGGGGSARALGARERAHPGAPRGHQDPHGADPHAQPGRIAGRGSRARRTPTSSTGRRSTPRPASSGSARPPRTCSPSAPAA